MVDKVSYVEERIAHAGGLPVTEMGDRQSSLPFFFKSREGSGRQKRRAELGTSIERLDAENPVGFASEQVECLGVPVSNTSPPSPLAGKMKFPILLITYVFVQISSCTQSDVPAEELAQTNPMASTSAYPALNSESETKEASSSDSSTVTASKAHDSSQDRYDTTTGSRSTAFAKITWNPVSSLVLSTDVLTKSPDYENTFPSSSLQNTTQYSGTNAFNYQTPPSIFENLDHEENELDSDTRVTDMSKSLKTTLNTDLPPLYTHKFETVHTESPTDNPHVLHRSVHHLLSESEDEPISVKTTKLDASFEQNVKSSTRIPMSPVSDYTIVEGSTSASATEFSNPELSAESKEMFSILTRDETITTDSSLFSSTKGISENLFRINMRETENMENSTFITERIKFSDDENLKSTTSLNIELDAENREQESDFYDSSLDPNSTYTESSKDLESVKTLSSSEKSSEGQELTSSLNLEMTPVSSFFDQSEKRSEMSTSTTTVALKDRSTDNLTPEKFPSTISDILSVDISSNTRLPPFTISTFHDESLPQNSSDLNSSQENHLSAVTEVTTSHSSYTIPIKSSDQEILSISALTGHGFSTTADDSITTTSLETDVSSIFQLNNTTVLTITEGYKESTIVSASVSEGIEMEKTIIPSIHSTEHLTSSDDEITENVSSSLERDRSSKYDASTVSNIEKETSGFSTSVISGLSDIAASTYSAVNTFEDTSKLLTTIDPNTMRGHYLPSTKKLSTATVKDIEESNTVTDIPLHKHMGRESSTDYFTEQSTVLQTVPYHWLPSTRTQLPSTVTNDIEESKSSNFAFISSRKDIDTETSTDIFTEQSTVPPTVSYHPLSSTTVEQSLSSTTDNAFSSFKPIHDFNTEETSTSKLESYTVTDEIATSLPESYSTDTSTALPEMHREGKHIPFSTASTVRVTDLSSEYGFLLVTTEKTPVNDTEVHYMQIQIEDINLIDRTNMITAIIQFPVDSVYKTDMKVKLARTHQWLDKVLTKEFQNWTRDPFEEVEEQENEIPFGNISIFYVKPTPETNDSHITMTFIIYNAWKNRTLPAHFVLGTLNFYSKELKESINASAVYFYHGLSTESYDLLSAVFDKYGIIIFTICLAVVGITILVCVVIFYRKKTRQSIHYLADSKLQQNLQEAVGIDLTPASIILQDEKEEKGNKICDDEGWLVPIADVPVAEDNNVPNVQDTKL
ncbi:hypothetical protein AVEN_46897-1 [Araneus ventricosus]|uniref:Uncharacterized protein n=1 Tax=Araneus ventricosus TaxID=182803 RepID=A0A4Y2CN68_ARAVE|nr:hypothetical protein AVEN_46897-1 [Araneus ventricosus]